MLRLSLLLVLAMILAAPASAQRCDRALASADASYLAGEFDAAISGLTRCLDAGSFSSSERRRAYRLVGLSYIGKDREAEARAAVASLLEVAPNYEPDPALDPPPFVRMVADARRNRPRTRSGSSGGTPGPSLAGGRGLAVSARAHGLGYADSDDDTLAGGGIDLALGYHLSSALSVRARLAGSAASGDAFDGQIGELGLGARYHLAGGRLAPYLGGGVTVQSATYEAGGESVTYTGPGGLVEGGLAYALTPTLALDGGVSAAFTSLGADGRPDDISASTVRLGLGVSWRP